MTNKNEIKRLAKEQIGIDQVLEGKDAIRIGDYEYAVPVIVEGIELFVTVTLVAKNWYDTKQAKAFDVDEMVEEYKFTVEDRAKRKALAEAKKVKKASK